MSLRRRKSKPCTRLSAFMSAMGDILGDERKRREWLWLEAHVKDDVESIEDLERVDPRLPARMLAITIEIEAMPDALERKAAYGRLLDERLPWLGGEPCACVSCVPTARAAS